MAKLGTKRLPGGSVSVKAVMSAGVAVAFKFIIRFINKTVWPGT